MWKKKDDTQDLEKYIVDQIRELKKYVKEELYDNGHRTKDIVRQQAEADGRLHKAMRKHLDKSMDTEKHIEALAAAMRLKPVTIDGILYYTRVDYDVKDFI